MFYVMCAIAYVLGSIPFSLLFGKWFRGIDIREHGSGNVGSTNALRILGKKIGIAVLVCDISKGILAAALPIFFGQDVHPIYVGLFAILGHSFSIFLKLKGGKAVATTAGVMIIAEPIVLLCVLVVFFIVLKLSKYVSLSSVVGVGSSMVFSTWLSETVIIFFTVCMFMLIFYKHIPNMKRIREKTEPKIKWL